MSNQNIHCSVAFCRYNEHGERCSLNQIIVTSQARRGAEQSYAVQASDTSCASFEAK